MSAVPKDKQGHFLADQQPDTLSGVAAQLCQCFFQRRPRPGRGGDDQPCLGIRISLEGAPDVVDGLRVPMFVLSYPRRKS